MALQIKRKVAQAPKAEVNAVAINAVHGKDSKRYLRYDVAKNELDIVGSIYTTDASQPLTIPFAEETVKGTHAMRGKDSKRYKRYDVIGEGLTGILYVPTDTETPAAVQIVFQEPVA